MVEATSGSLLQFDQHVMQHLAEGLLVLDESAQIVFTNHMAELLLDCPSGELVGRPIQSLWPTYQSDVRSCLEVTRHEVSFELPRGVHVPLTVTVIPMHQAGQRARLLSFVSEGESEQLGTTLTHLQRLAGVGTLTASITHELANPISIITSTCDNLRHEIKEGSLSAEQLATYLEMIEQSAWRSARIIDVLRNYTHNHEPVMAVTNLNMIIDDSLALIQDQLRKQFNVEIEKQLAEGLPTIVCDHNRVSQVLINLLTNARDAMDANGGQVSIHSWSVTAAEDGFPEGAIAFSVRDNGHGIRPEIMDRMFDPFFTTKPSGQGTGLGLFIARSIVRQHRGRIWATSPSDGGALFTVMLPRRQPA